VTATTGPGTVYLIHFDRPYKHAKHYCGWARDLPARLADHAAGRGPRLMAVIAAAGIGWRLARTWSGGRTLERRIKDQGSLARHCPLCGVTPRLAARDQVSELPRLYPAYTAGGAR
jgi:predicted GIY-YIG superfamily endonuclease